MAAFSAGHFINIASHEMTLAVITIIIGMLVVLAGVLWRVALPKPIAGIPFSANAAKRILGDIPDMKKAKGVRFWMLDQFVKHNSPIVQIFVDPFKKSRVIVSDFTEAYDVLMRRNTEFDKSTLTSDSFSGVVAASLISMKTPDRRFKHNKELMRDLMTPSFLNEVRILKTHTVCLFCAIIY